MRHNESKLQQQCIKWICLQYPNIICMAIPNGGKRSRTEAAIMKAEGVLAGAADLFIPKSNKDYYGLFIELKIGNNKQTDAQKWFELNVKRDFYEYVVVRSLEDFMVEVNNYLKN